MIRLKICSMVGIHCYRAYFFHALRPTQGGTGTQDDTIYYSLVPLMRAQSIQKRIT